MGLELFDKCLSPDIDDNKFYLTYLTKGKCLYRLGKLEESIKIFEQGMQLNPLDPSFLWGKSLYKIK
jgi:tetratricopeptide (TPR) repeat protein